MIQFKRGLKANLPVLKEGEPAFTKDTKEFFVGSPDGNVQLAGKEEVSTLSNQIGNQSGLPSWLVKSLYEVAKMHDDYIRQHAVNVRQPPYNAKGDGINNDKSIIQQAISDLAGKSGIIYIPDGTYAYPTSSLPITVPSNVRLIGSGTKLTGDVASMISITGSEVVISGITFENTKASGAVTINFASNVNNISITNNKFLGSGTQAVNIATIGIKGIYIANNVFDGVRYGVLTNSGATDVHDIRIIGNRFINIYADGIELNHPSSAPYTSAGYDITIQGNYISCPNGTGATSGVGIGLAGVTRVSIVGNVIRNCRWQGIHIEDECKHISIVGNIIDGTLNEPALTTNGGIYLIDGDFITVQGNSVYNCNDTGIHFDYDATNNATNSIISGNTVYQSNIGIKFSGNGNVDSIIKDNVVNGCTTNGIEITGGGIGLAVRGNISRNNGGYGLRINNSKVGNWYSENSLYGNTSGDILFENLTFPIAMKDGNNVITSSLTAQYTPYLNILNLGVGAKGTLYVMAKDNSSNYATKMVDVKWDGTTLTATDIATKNNGNMSMGALQMSGNLLQTRAFQSGGTDGATITFDIQWQGMSMIK